MSILPDVSAASLHEFILNNVQKGSAVRTDGWRGYNGVEDLGYRHIVTNMQQAEILHMSSCLVSIE